MEDDVKQPLWWDIRDRLAQSPMPFQELAGRLGSDEGEICGEAAQQMEIALLEFFNERGMEPVEFLRIYHRNLAAERE
jgi:hypothetical protein